MTSNQRAAVALGAIAAIWVLAWVIVSLATGNWGWLVTVLVVTAGSVLLFVLIRAVGDRVMNWVEAGR